MTEPSVLDRIASALTGLHSAVDARPDDGLSALIDCVLTAVPQAEQAGVARAVGEGLELLAANGAVVEQFIAMQTEIARGPSLDAAADPGPVRSDDLDRDDRWAGFGPSAAKATAVRSAVAVRLPLEPAENPLVLTVLSGRVAAFTDDAVLTVLASATCCGLALVSARRAQRIGNLERALETNRDIGTAVGVLMALRRTTREHAFELLRSLSQASHRKVSDIARSVAETGSLDAI